MTTKQLLRKVQLKQGSLITYKTQLNDCWDSFIASITRDIRRITFATKTTQSEKIAASPYDAFEKLISQTKKEVSSLHKRGTEAQSALEKDYDSGVLLAQALKEAGVKPNDSSIKEREIRLKLLRDYTRKAFSVLESLNKFMDVAGYVTDKLPIRIPNIPWLTSEDEDTKYKGIIRDLKRDSRKDKKKSEVLDVKKIKEQVLRYNPNPLDDTPLFPDETSSSEELRETAKAIEDYLMGAGLTSQRSSARKLTLKVLKDLGYEKASEAVGGIFASIKTLAIVKKAAIQDHLSTWRGIITDLENVSESVIKGPLKDAYTNLAKAWSDEKYKANLIALNNFVKGGEGKVGFLEGFSDGFVKAIDGNIVVAERAVEEAVQSIKFSNEQKNELAAIKKKQDANLAKYKEKTEKAKKSDIASIDSFSKLKEAGATDEQIAFLRGQTQDQLIGLVESLPQTGQKEFVQEYIDKEVRKEIEEEDTQESQNAQEEKRETQDEKGKRLYEETKRTVKDLHEELKELQEIIDTGGDATDMTLLKQELFRHESALSAYKALLSEDDIDDVLGISAKSNYKGLSTYAQEPFTEKALEELKIVTEKAREIIKKYKNEDQVGDDKELEDMLRLTLDGIRKDYKNKIVQSLQISLDKEELALEVEEPLQATLKEFNEIVFKIIDDKTNQLASNMQRLKEFFTDDSPIQKEFVNELITDILGAWEEKKKEVLGKVVASSFGFKKLSQATEDNSNKVETILTELVKEEVLTKMFEETFRENLDKYDEKTTVLIEKAKGEGKELTPTSSLFKRLSHNEYN